jgi:sugar transferase (PEP-CTERM system associated)
MGTVRVFGHPIRSQILFLALIELFILLGSVYAGVGIRVDTMLDTDLAWLAPRMVVFTVMMMTCMLAMGLYQARLRTGPLGVVLRLMTSYVLCGAGLAVVFYVIPELYISRGTLALIALLSAFGIGLVRLILFSPMVENALRRRTLVLGAGQRARNIVNVPRRSDLVSCNILGFVPVNGETRVVDAARVLNVDTPLADYASARQVDEIVVAVEDRRRNLPLEQLMECRMRGINILDELTFFERESGKVRLDMLQPSWIIFSDGFQLNSARRYSKRLFDVVASLTLLGLTWPIMALTALALLIENRGRGPVFYQQYRIGQGGHPFMLLKFRSMRVNAEADGAPRWAQVNDSRITQVGRFIRRFRIDELPQILNILRGEMSFIGPRPERPEFVSQLSKQISYYSERHRLKPGLSGWAQLCYPYGASTEDAIEKLQYDLYYVKNHNLFLDLSILLQTLEVVFFGRGVR